MDVVYHVVRKKKTDSHKIQGTCSCVFATQELAEAQAESFNQRYDNLLSDYVYSVEAWSVLEA